MSVDIAATVAIVALTAAWLVYDRRRQGDDQRVVAFAGVGAFAMLLDSLGPFGSSSEALPTSMLLVVSAAAFALAGSSAVRRPWTVLKRETPNGT
jgi:hypothetical protein